MTHKLPTEAIKTLLIACHEAKRIVELQPPLPEGLTPGNLKVLDYIEYLERTAQPPKVSDIADLLQVTRPGITRLVSELQAINVIEKISDKQDKRIVRLRMTDEGRKIHAYYIEQYHSWLAAQISDISEADINTTAATIAKLYQTMSTHKPALQGHAPAIRQRKEKNSSTRVLDARLLFSIIAAGIMSFSGVVVETAMNVTFPTLMHEFNIGTSLVQWITTGYLLVLALIIPTSAYLKRRFATRSLFTAAINSFLAGTLLAAWSPYFNVLLVGRLLQGIGTGIALPMMFNIILEQVPGERLGFMIGVASLITAMAPAVGPSLGGMIVSYFGWRMIFVSLLPFLLLSAFLGIRNIRQAGKLEQTSFNFGLYLLLVIGFSSLIFATSIASDFGWFSIEVLALFAICLVALTAFYKQSLSSNAPLLRVEIFRYLPYTLSTASLLLVGFICLGLGFLIPNYAQLVSHTDAFTAGCLLLPGCIIGAMLAPISGRLLDKFGAKRPILLGNTSILVSVICYSLYPEELSSLLFIVFYLFFAFGQGFSMGTIMTNGLSQLPEELNADGNAAMNTLLQLAGAVGTAVISTIVATAQAAEPANIAHATMLGSRHGFFVLTASAVIILCCSLKVFASIRRQAK